MKDDDFPFCADCPDDDEQSAFPDRSKFSLKRIQWAPAVDIYETGSEVVAIVEIPGVRPDDIHVSFKDGSLSIEGVKHKICGIQGLSFFCVERSYGSFKRSFRIVSSVDKKKIEARFDNGVLTVILPKAAASKKAGAHE